MNYTSFLIALILGMAIAVIVTLGVAKSLYAKKAGVIMKRMCTCSQDEREMFWKVLSKDSNGFGTDIFHLFDSK